MLLYQQSHQQRNRRVPTDISGQNEVEPQGIFLSTVYPAVVVEAAHHPVEHARPLVEHLQSSVGATFFEEVVDDTTCVCPLSVNGVNHINAVNRNGVSFPTFQEELSKVLQKHQLDIQDLFNRFQIEPAVPSEQFGVSLASNPQAFPQKLREECETISKAAPSEPHMPEVLETISVCQSFAESEIHSVTIIPEATSTSAQSLRKSHSFSNFLPSWKSTRKTPWDMIQFRVWNFLEHPDGGLSNQLFHSILNFLIAVSVASPVMATTNISKELKAILDNGDIFFTTLFAVEFLTKVIFYPDRWGYLKSLYTLIDIAVVFAGFLGIFLADVESIWLDLISTQVPILRLLKITRHSSGWRLLMMAMKNSVVPLLVPLYLMLLMIVFTGSLHFWIDNVLACTSPACSSDEGPAFQSIPQAMWFVLVSLSTVGYGDITPHTDAGKLLACLQIVMGLCYMAMPLAIIGNSFSEVWNDRHRILLSDKLAHGAIKRDIKDVKKLFYTFDDDKSGTISLDEFLPFVESLEMGLSKRVIHDLFRSIDLDGSGIISFDEFAEFVFPDSQREEDAEVTEE